jgi:CMP-N,N'-diacetyllegionaminic acid synthase
MLAVIPARGGSKGLPGKNLKLLAGKPLIAHTIETALITPELSRIIVSTEDEVIARVAEQFGAEVPFMRPTNLASDNSLAIDTYKYTVDKLINDEGIDIDEYLVLLPTSPLRDASDISNAVKIFRNKNANSVISVTKGDKPVSWFKSLDTEGRLLENDITLKNRQDEDDYYCPNGSIYIFKKELIDEGKYYSDKTYSYVMPKSRSVDIDFEIDLQFAEFLILNNHAQK